MIAPSAAVLLASLTLGPAVAGPPAEASPESELQQMREELRGLRAEISAMREVMERFDHKDLNGDTHFFDKIPPTPENLAVVISGLLRSALPAGTLDRIRLHQDADLFVEVLEDPA